MVWGYAWWWVWIVGAILAVLGELVHEIIENSECVIQLYRNNSGTSGQYEGKCLEESVPYLDSVVSSQVTALRILLVIWSLHCLVGTSLQGCMLQVNKYITACFTI